mgnify:CR=1 FL=1|jgi:nitrous oxidase accessory protein
MNATRFIILVAVLVSVPGVASVPANETPRPMSVIAEMIDRANPGDEIMAPRGVYVGNLIIRKPIVLNGSDGVIFDGLGKGSVIEVRADHVTIHNCTIRATGKDVTGEPAAIRVTAAHATIDSNVIEDALFGLDLREAPNAVIRNNTIACKDLDPGRRGDGIRLWWSHGCVIEDNTVRGSRDMVFWYSENLYIARNTVSDSRYGLHFMYSHDTILEENNLFANSVGVYLMYSNRITLKGNQLTNNRGASGYGIGLKDCDAITIIGNAFLANRVGVYLDNSPSSVDSTGRFESNLIAFNEVGLLATPNTHDNVFTGNAFIENEEPAATHGRGRLVSNAFAHEGVGNYWSDYAGFDLDGDGIGDVAYEPQSLFGAMLANEPNLRLFVHSPAQNAVEFTSRALPELRPESTLIDPSPMVSPPEIHIAATQHAGENGSRMALVAAALLSLATVGVVVMGADREWRTSHAKGLT